MFDYLIAEERRKYSSKLNRRKKVFDNLNKI